MVMPALLARSSAGSSVLIDSKDGKFSSVVPKLIEMTSTSLCWVM